MLSALRATGSPAFHGGERWFPDLRARAIAFVSASSLALGLLQAVPVGAVAPPVVPAQSIDPLRPSITQYRIDTWQTEQGLPLNTVQSMYQTRAGYLWVGTAGGIARFDGIRFATFETAAVPELTSRPIFGSLPR